MKLRNLPQNNTTNKAVNDSRVLSNPARKECDYDLLVSRLRSDPQFFD